MLKTASNSQYPILIKEGVKLVQVTGLLHGSGGSTFVQITVGLQGSKKTDLFLKFFILDALDDLHLRILEILGLVIALFNNRFLSFGLSLLIKAASTLFMKAKADCYCFLGPKPARKLLQAFGQGERFLGLAGHGRNLLYLRIMW